MGYFSELDADQGTVGQWEEDRAIYRRDAGMSPVIDLTTIRYSLRTAPDTGLTAPVEDPAGPYDSFREALRGALVANERPVAVRPESQRARDRRERKQAGL